MEMKEFALKVQKGVSRRLGAEAQVKLQEVTKNNGVVLQGLSIGRQGRNVSSTVYLDAFYEMYGQGTAMNAIVEKIAALYLKDAPGESVDMDFFQDFDMVKERIAYRLINAGRNEELLKRIPHIRFLDLAVCFYYAFSHEELGKGIITIYNNHMELWHTSTRELLSLAQENTKRIFGVQCRPLVDVLGELVDGIPCQDGKEDEYDELLRMVPMKILSNGDRVHGAACLLYPGLLQEICGKEEKNYYILPSSVHEVILLADDGAEDPEKLREMVREVNEQQVEPEEVLSDSVYYYDCVKKQIKIV